jgi:hypothetical protein
MEDRTTGSQSISPKRENSEKRNEGNGIIIRDPSLRLELRGGRSAVDPCFHESGGAVDGGNWILIFNADVHVGVIFCISGKSAMGWKERRKCVVG